MTALRDALDAVKRTEKLLEKLDRPALVKLLGVLGPLLRAVDSFAKEHAAVVLDLRMARLRIQAILGPEAREGYDPDKTPIEPLVRRSQSSTQIGAIKPRPGGDER